MNDDFLNGFRRPPSPQFAARLYERISPPMSTLPQRSARRRAWLTAGGALAALLFGILLFPSARAFAGGIIQQIGAYGFTVDPSLVPPTHKPSPINIVQSQTSVEMQVTGKVPNAQDTAGAGKLAGFTVLAPSYLPAGYSPMSDWLVTPQGSGMIATKGYRDATNHFLIINEWRAGDSPEQVYPRDSIVNVTVHGQPALWLPGAAGQTPTPSVSPAPGPIQARPEGKNVLVWAENGITYSVVGDVISQTDAIAVAEGLGK